jgi:hypothetical protein
MISGQYSAQTLDPSDDTQAKDWSAKMENNPVQYKDQSGGFFRLPLGIVKLARITAS